MIRVTRARAHASSVVTSCMSAEAALQPGGTSAQEQAAVGALVRPGRERVSTSRARQLSRIEVDDGDVHPAAQDPLRRFKIMARDREPVLGASTAAATVGGREHAALDAGALEVTHHLLEARKASLGDDQWLAHTLLQGFVRG